MVPVTLTDVDEDGVISIQLMGPGLNRLQQLMNEINDAYSKVTADCDYAIVLYLCLELLFLFFSCCDSPSQRRLILWAKYQKEWQLVLSSRLMGAGIALLSRRFLSQRWDSHVCTYHKCKCATLSLSSSLRPSSLRPSSLRPSSSLLASPSEAACGVCRLWEWRRARQDQTEEGSGHRALLSSSSGEVPWHADNRTLVPNLERIERG